MLMFDAVMAVVALLIAAVCIISFKQTREEKQLLEQGIKRPSGSTLVSAGLGAFTEIFHPSQQRSEEVREQEEERGVERSGAEGDPTTAFRGIVRLPPGLNTESPDS